MYCSLYPLPELVICTAFRKSFGVMVLTVDPAVLLNVALLAAMLNPPLLGPNVMFPVTRIPFTWNWAMSPTRAWMTAAVTSLRLIFPAITVVLLLLPMYTLFASMWATLSPALLIASTMLAAVTWPSAPTALTIWLIFPASTVICPLSVFSAPFARLTSAVIRPASVVILPLSVLSALLRSVTSCRIRLSLTSILAL